MELLLLLHGVAGVMGVIAKGEPLEKFFEEGRVFLGVTFEFLMGCTRRENGVGFKHCFYLETLS